MLKLVVIEILGCLTFKGKRCRNFLKRKHVVLEIVMNLIVVGNVIGGNKMGHSWMNALRTSEEYENRVEEFIEFARRNALTKNGIYFCTCVNCLNESRWDIDDIRDHLLCD